MVQRIQRRAPWTTLVESGVLTLTLEPGLAPGSAASTVLHMTNTPRHARANPAHDSFDRLLLIVGAAICAFGLLWAVSGYLSTRALANEAGTADLNEAKAAAGTMTTVGPLIPRDANGSVVVNADGTVNGPTFVPPGPIEMTAIRVEYAQKRLSTAANAASVEQARFWEPLALMVVGGMGIMASVIRRRKSV